MNKKISLGILLILALLIGGVVLASYQKSQTAKRADRASAAAEQQFIEQMTSHHQDAIQMAQMAGVKAKNKQVRSLASGILTAQTKEVSAMKSWYRQWYGKGMPTVAAMPGMMHDGINMTRLSTAADFDSEFISQMIPHHQSAVSMAREILAKAKHAEIKQLAADILDSQTLEIRELQQLQQVLKQYPFGSAGRKAINCGDDSPGC